MKTEIAINDLNYDDIDIIKSSIDNNERFQIMIYEGGMEDDDGDEIPCVGFWIENLDDNKACTIMCHITKKHAIYLGKSLIAMAKLL